MLTFAESINQSRDLLHAQLNTPIDEMIVLGSGLSDLSLNGFKLEHTIPYKKIPCLPTPTAPSHVGELRIYQTSSKEIKNKTIAVCAGRFHLYEGYDAQQVSMLVYLLNQLGAKRLMITNAAGALNSSYKPGEVMLIEDHINFTGHNPLIGQDDHFGMRFPDMSEAYSKALLTLAHRAAEEHKITVHQGIYAGVTGPSLETSAERRMLHTLGGDAVGMSTVVEVIAAKHCSMDVLGLSAITNLALGDKDQQPDTIEAVLENAAIAGLSISKIIKHVVAD